MKRISDEELDKLLREKLVFSTYPMSAEIINALEELKARREASRLNGDLDEEDWKMLQDLIDNPQPPTPEAAAFLRKVFNSE